MQDTARKISCLLKDSVTYGAKVYRELVGQQDVYGRIFSTKIQLLPDQYDIQKFEAMMNAAIVASPDLVSFIDPFQIMRVAKEDVKMAEAIFRQGQKKMIIHNQQAAMMNQQQTIEGQIASAQAAEQAKQQTEALKGEISIKEKEVTAKAQNQSAVVNLVASLLTPQTNAEGKTTTPTIPAELQPLVRSVVENIMITAVASTEEQKMKIIAEMQAAREQQAAQQQQNIQPTPVNNNPQVAV